MNNISKMFPAILLEKLMKNVLPENRDVNQKGGSGNQDNQPRREFLSEGDREIPDIAGQRIG